jgi:hypothetical protein
MKRKSATADLQNTIALLKIRQAQELQALKEQFHSTKESLKPGNIIKSSLKTVATAPGIKGTLLKTGLGLATAYFSKRLLFRAVQKPVKKILGTILKVGVAGFIAKRMRKEKEPAATQ